MELTQADFPERGGQAALRENWGELGRQAGDIKRGRYGVSYPKGIESAPVQQLQAGALS